MVALNSSSGVSPGVPRGNSIQISVGGWPVRCFGGVSVSGARYCQVSGRVVAGLTDFDHGIDVTRGRNRQRVQPRMESMLGVSTTTTPAR
jgi:hypothetical protein